ncbi:PAS domain S-box protein [Pedobacter jamesrossensis]
MLHRKNKRYHAIDYFIDEEEMMIKDKLLLKFLAGIREPAVILSPVSGTFHIQAANESYCDLLGFTEKKLLGLDLFGVLSLRTEDATRMWNVLNGLKGSNSEASQCLADYSNKSSLPHGHRPEYEVKSILLASRSENSIYILQTVNEILVSDPVSGKTLFPMFSHRADNCAILHSVAQGTEEPFVLLDRELRITFFNNKFYSLYKEYYGKSIEVGRHILEYAQENRRQIVAEIYKKVLGGESAQSEITAQVTANLLKKLQLIFKPIVGSSETVEGVFVSAKDITLQLQTEKQLLDNERDLEIIYDNLQDAIFVVDVCHDNAFRFRTVNKAFLRITGLSEAEVLNSLIEEVIPETHLNATLSHYKECISTGIPISREEAVLYPTGERTVIITVTPVFDNVGKCEKLIGSIHDITHHRELEKEMESTNRKLSRILEASPDVISTLDMFGNFISLSAASKLMWGYPPESLVGRSIGDFLHIEDKKAMKKVLDEIVQGGESIQIENRMRRSDRTYITLVWSMRWDDKDQIIFAVAKDGTEKQLAQEKLMMSEQRFKALVQDGSDLIAILDVNGDYMYVSPTSQSVLETPPDEYIGKNAFEFIHPEDRDATMAGFHRLGTDRKIALPPFRFRHHDGSWRWMETVITNLIDEPAVKGVVANSRDITDRIDTQKAILRINERYRFATKATSDAIWDWDIETNKIYWGDGLQRLFFWDSHQLSSDIGAWANLVHPDDFARVNSKLDLLLESSENQWSDEYRLKRGDGEFSIVMDKGFIVRDDNGSAIRMVGAIKDVTKQRKEEHQLKLLESVVTQTSDLVMITDANYQDAKIIYVNDSFCHTTGYSATELLGRSPSLLQGKKTDRKELDKLANCLKRGESCQISVVNYKKNGEEFWNSFSVSPVADKDGSIIHLISIGRDITGLMNLQQQEKIMSSVSQIFSRNRGLMEAIEKTMKLLARSGKYEYSEIWMLDHDGLQMSLMGRLAPDSNQENTETHTDTIRKLKRSKGFAGMVWKTSSIQFGNIAGISGDFISKKNPSNDLIYQVCGIPLFDDKEIIGVLVFGAQGRKIKWDSEATLERLGLHLGAEIRRKQLEQELEQLFDFAPDIIAISDFEGYFKKINPAASTILGYTDVELISKPFTDFLHPEEKRGAIDRIKAQRAAGSVYFIEERYITRTGKLKWLAWTSQIMEDRGLIFSVGKDITERKNLEDLLHRTNSLARVGSWEIDVVAGTVYWSDVTKEIREVEPDFEPDIDTGISYFRSENERLTIRKRVDECIANGIPWDEELEILTFKGNPKWIRTIGQAEMLDGKCIRIFGSFQDIDARKRAELEAESVLRYLEESEKRYSELFHLSPLPMWVYDCDTLKFLDVNQTAMSHYGYGYEEFMDMTLKDIRPAEEIPAMEETVRLTREKGYHFYQGLFRHNKKNGEVIDVEIKSNIIDFKGRNAKVVVVHDITDRLKYFNAMEKQNKVLKEISWIQSHVVRAPLAKLMGLVTLLAKPSMQNKDKQNFLIANIEHCTAELDTIVREITEKSEKIK